MPWLIRIEIDREKMIEKDITLLEIKAKLFDWWINQSKINKKEEKQILTKINNIIILINNDNHPHPVVHIRMNFKNITKKDNLNVDYFNNIIEVLIEKFKIKGFDDIINIEDIIDAERNITFDNSDAAKELKKEKEQYVIRTHGINMIDIRNIKGIDLNKTISNDIVDTYEKFGIEITRTILLNEILSAYTGKSLNYQHAALLVDLMTANGFLISIDRHGANRANVDPLSKASFEKVVEHLVNASAFGEVDHLRGISSRIMAGQCIKGGTGYCDIMLDVEAIQKSEYLDDYQSNTFQKLDDINFNQVIVSTEFENFGFVPV
jgi:DNA-directed RNA polymerase II subunit RPB1